MAGQLVPVTVIDDVRYVRVIDWDIPPTEFEEFITFLCLSSFALFTFTLINFFLIFV